VTAELAKSEGTATRSLAVTAPLGSRGLVRLLRPEWVFLTLALLFGSAFLVLTPPYQVPDEEAHFRRAFEISLGHIIPIKQGEYTGDYLPRGVEAPWQRFQVMRAHPEEKTSAAQIAETSDLAFSSTDREFVSFSNTAIHAPLTYLPQALGILLARQFSSSVLVCFYAARVFNYLATTALFFFAIRVTPVAKWGFAALALTPMALFMTASLSSDALTNSLSFLFIARVLACALGPQERLPSRALAWTALFGMGLGLVKLMYFFLPLCYFLIPVRKAGTRSRYWIWFGLVMGATLLPVLTWSFVVRSVYSKPDPKLGMDPSEQIHRMFAHSDEFGRLLLKTVQRGQTYGEEYLGFLGWLDTRLPGWVYLLQVTLLIAICVSDNDPRTLLSGWQALLALAVAVIVSLSVALIAHITWDPIGAAYITVQGRYFIPVGPLLAVALSYTGRSLPIAWQAGLRFVPVAAVGCIAVVLSTSLRGLYDRYFVDSQLARAERCYQRAEALRDLPGQEEQAFKLYEEAIQIDADHPGAHFRLGLHLEQTHPRQAADHLRAALRREPGHVTTLNHLGGILAQQGEFPEAIRCFEEAIRLKPEDVYLKNNLSQTLSQQKSVTDFLRRLSLAVPRLARAILIDERYRGSEQEWLHLKPNRGPVVDSTGKSPLPLEFVWRSPPPSRRSIVASSTVGSSRPFPFYACSAMPFGPKRVFVFPPPLNAVHLADEDVSWFFQVPLQDLNEAERAAEDTYRKEKRLLFPLTALPE
jgi:uncharacterized membrane protein